MVRDNLL